MSERGDGDADARIPEKRILIITALEELGRMVRVREQREEEILGSSPGDETFEPARGLPKRMILDRLAPLRHERLAPPDGFAPSALSNPHSRL